MTDFETPPREQTKTEILSRLRRSFEELEEILRPLDDARLSMPIDNAGWSIKDHLTHIAAWELGMVSLLQHRDRFAAMGLEHSAVKGKSEEETNDMIFKLNAGLSAAQAWEMLRNAHRQMEAQLESMDNDDFYTPYTTFLPAGARGSEKPIVLWIIGNTYAHYDEHIGWLRELLEA